MRYCRSRTGHDSIKKYYKKHSFQRMSKQNNNGNDNDTSSTSSPWTSSSAIQERVKQRVEERNRWPTYAEPTPGKVMKLLCGDAKQILFQTGLPSTKQLDDIFPVQDVDWDKLRNVNVHGDGDGDGDGGHSGDSTSNSTSNSTSGSIQSTWIGHSTMLVQMGGWNILTDPVFSQRCSAVQFAGPKRLRRPACTIQDLYHKGTGSGSDSGRNGDHVGMGVGVDIVLVSHNHYDHLDYASVQELADTALRTNKPLTFVVPLGLKKWFQCYIPNSHRGNNQVVELDWHETFTLPGCPCPGTRSDGDNDEQGRGRGIESEGEAAENNNNNNKKRTSLEITGLPMQHWSNRNGFDKDKSLWCGFAVKAESKNFLFSGDTGYFDGLRDIGRNYGPFDLAAIPIGAYEPRWFMIHQHTNPDDAVKMMTDVRATHAFGIHWGTFALTIEPFMEPRERLAMAMESAGKDVSTFMTSRIGETIVID